MAGFTLKGSEIGFISKFQSITRATPLDCVIEEDDSITFIMDPGSMGLAIGKKGSNLKQASKVFNRGLKVVEYSEDPVKFIKNVMYPIKPKAINIEGSDQKKVAKIAVERKERATAIGSRGRNIKRLRTIVKRHHELDDVMII